MTTLLFYQVAESTPAAVDAVLPSLLGKIVGTGQPILLLAPTAERAQRIDEHLWGYAAESFLPHAQAGTPRDAAQPILVGNLEQQPEILPLLPANQANRLPVLLAGAEAPLPTLLGTNPEKLCYLFSTAPTDVARARTLYKQFKDAGHSLRYFAQEGERWVQK